MLDVEINVLGSSVAAILVIFVFFSTSLTDINSPVLGSYFLNVAIWSGSSSHIREPSGLEGSYQGFPFTLIFGEPFLRGTYSALLALVNKVEAPPVFPLSLI